MDGYVDVQLKSGVGFINFYHPKGNSLPSKLLLELKNAFRELDEKKAKVIILSSEGDKVFCGGASFDELIQLSDKATAEIFFLGFADLMAQMVSSNAIIIGAISGKVVGGGVGLMSACDYNIVNKNVMIKLSEFKVGIGPFAIGPMVKYRIGLNAFSALTINPSQWYEGTHFITQNFIGEFLKENKSVLERAKMKAEELIRFNPTALAQFKKLLWSDNNTIISQMKSNAKISAELVLQDEARKFLNEFK